MHSMYVKELNKIYYANGVAYHALKNFSAAFEKGETVFILGPSGCGKSTLLNLLGGLDNPSSGELVIDQKMTSTYKEHNWDTLRNKSIGFIFQSYNLIDYLTIEENVILPLKLRGTKKAEALDRAKELLFKVGLEDHIGKPASNLSGGQRQRVAVARALVGNPEVILADEPTGAVDKKTSSEIMKLINDLTKDKLCIIVSHNERLAKEHASRIIRMKDGYLVDDPRADLLNEKTQVSKKVDYSRVKYGFFNSLKHSFKNVKLRMFRAFFTALALSIGIFAMMFTDSVGNGIRYNMEVLQEQFNNDNYFDVTSYDLDTNKTFDELYDESYNELESTGYFNYIHAQTSSFLDVIGSTVNPGYPIETVSLRSGELSPLDSLIGDSRMPLADDEIVISANTLFYLHEGKVDGTPIPKEMYERYINKNIKFVDKTIIEFLGGFDDGSGEKIATEDYGNWWQLKFYTWDGNSSNLPVEYGTSDVFDETTHGLFTDHLTAINSLYGSNTATLVNPTDGVYAFIDREQESYGTLEEVYGFLGDTIFDESILDEYKIVGVYNTKYSELGLNSDHVYTTSNTFKKIMNNVIDSEGNFKSNIEDSVNFTVSVKEQYVNSAELVNYLTLSNGYQVDSNGLVDSIAIFLIIFSFLTYFVQIGTTVILSISVITAVLMTFLVLKMSVSERRREIGILRSLGGSKLDVRRVFTAEAIIIGIFAFIISLAVLIGTSLFVNNVLYYDYQEFIDATYLFIGNKVSILSPTKLIIAFIISAFIGFLSGFLPASKASKSAPVDAIRG